MKKLNPAAQAVKEIEGRERAHLTETGEARVFYHPGFSANGHWTRDGFKPHGCPEGWTLDVAAWERNGRTGPAPLVQSDPEPVLAADVQPVVEETVTDG